MTSLKSPLKILFFDVIIIGAGASGLMCAIEAGKRARHVLVLDHAHKAGKKILMSGGGRCNFTNYTVEADHYISSNSHFCKSALSRYNQWDFLALIHTHNIAFHAREHGQLFCDNSAKDIVNMLLTEARKSQVTLQLKTVIDDITSSKTEGFVLKSAEYIFKCQSLVIATGGLSIPKIGATPFGYQIAKQFDIPVLPTRAGLVPFTLQPEDKETLSLLAGISIWCRVSNQRQSFEESMLFTHRGLSGPVILQLSSYWQVGDLITINLLPTLDLKTLLTEQRQNHNPLKVKKFLSAYLPKRLLATCLPANILDSQLTDLSDKKIHTIQQIVQQWQIKPSGTEGYRTAEVTLGGIDCNALSSKTFESKSVNGLFFIGEVLDVTGWLGGYNFQWAWSSGWCAGQYV
jgi:predicted Rossmann fold flavoprotein